MITDDFVEIELKEQEDFLKIKETLTRIGVASRKEKTLYQSCHILHKQGKYYIVHFKELFLLDGKNSSLTDNDIARRNTIIKLLEEWDLLKIKNINVVDELVAPLNQIKVVPFKEKNEWNLVAKYTIGKRSN
jgi:hypothetical protein